MRRRRGKVGCAVNGQLIGEELLVFLGAASVLNGVARRVGPVKVHGDLLTEASCRVVHHECVDALVGGQIGRYQHGDGVVFPGVGPAVVVCIVGPFLPHHGRHGVGQDGLVADGDLNDLRRARRPVVVAVHRCRHHAGFDRVNGEGSAQASGSHHRRLVQGNQAHFPFDVAVGERNGFGEVPEGPVQLSGVANRRSVSVEDDLSIAVNKSSSLVDVLKTNLRWRRSWFLRLAGTGVRGSSCTRSFSEKHDGFQLEIVFVALRFLRPTCERREWKSRRFGASGARDGELRFIVPLWSKSERMLVITFVPSSVITTASVGCRSTRSASPRPAGPPPPAGNRSVAWLDLLKRSSRWCVDRCSNDLVFGADGLPFF